MTVAGKSGTGTVKVQFQSNSERLEKQRPSSRRSRRRNSCESEIEVLDNEIAGLAENYEFIRGELDEALTLTGIKRPKTKEASKPRDPRPHDDLAAALDE